MRLRAIARRRSAARPHRGASAVASLRTAAAPRVATPLRTAAPPRTATPLAPRSMPAVRPRLRTAAAGATLLLATTATTTATIASAAPARTTDAPTAAACAAATAQPGQRSRPTLRAALRCAVDAERGGHGLAALRPDRRLHRAARRHARDMVRHSYFAHERAGWTFAGRLAAAGWTGGSAAEAIAWGCDGRGSPLATLQGWLASPPHRAIVLGNYRRVGVGLVLGTPGSAGCGPAGTWVLDVGA
jgi:uncharacterized protein YkwD